MDRNYGAVCHPTDGRGYWPAAETAPVGPLEVDDALRALELGDGPPSAPGGRPPRHTRPGSDTAMTSDYSALSASSWGTGRMGSGSGSGGSGTHWTDPASPAATAGGTGRAAPWPDSSPVGAPSSVSRAGPPRACPPAASPWRAAPPHGEAVDDVEGVYEGENDDDADEASLTSQRAPVKVVVRVRPPLPRELSGQGSGSFERYREAVTVDRASRQILLKELAPEWGEQRAAGEGVVGEPRQGAGPSHPTPDAFTAGALLAGGKRAAGGAGAVPAPPQAPRPAAVLATHTFRFDAVHGPESTQAEVYASAARDAVRGVLAGLNATIIAYGQTGTGKTWTMMGGGGAGVGAGGGARGSAPSGEGGPMDAGDLRGIVPRAVTEVFRGIESRSRLGNTFLVRASYCQIYNEAVTDLLKGPGGPALTVREDRKRGVRVEGLSEWVVRAPSDVQALWERGDAARATGATRSNDLSSRSHAIFTLVVEACAVDDGGTGGTDEAGRVGAGAGRAEAGRDGAGQGGGAGARRVRVGKLNLVDLAGSERVAVTGATGRRLDESKKINQSLSCLGNVIAALTAARQAPPPSGGEGDATDGAGSAAGGPPLPSQNPHVPYRDSKLTRILEDSLGGNCRTTFLATLAPGSEAASEGLSTLKFARRASRVVTAPTVNEDLDHRTLLRRYERELRRLRAELAQKSRDLVDKRLVLELDAARRREEADKLAAISALERQSAEISRHKAAMAGLQTRISALASQLLLGGGAGRAHGGGPGDVAAPGPGAGAGSPYPRAPAASSSAAAVRAAIEAEQARVREAYSAQVAQLERERFSLGEERAAAGRARELLARQRDVMAALTRRLAERDASVTGLRARLEAAEDEARALGDALDAKTGEVLALRRREVDRDGEKGGGGVGGRPAGQPAGAGKRPEVARGSNDADDASSGWTIASGRGEGGAGGGGDPTTLAPSAGPDRLEVAHLRIANLEAERSALRSILGTKMRNVIVDLEGMLSREETSGEGGGDRGPSARPTPLAAARDRAALLGRLLDATASALAPRGG